ncbi:MAG: hypothetical protein ACK5LJ_10000 [Paracoccus sp. (in: a-proteobacteria)]
MSSLILPTLAAFLLPGLTGWFAGRRFGIRALWTVLAAGAVLAIWGWLNTRTPLAHDAARDQAVLIFFILLPGVVSLITGTLIGAWQFLTRQPG